MSMKKIIELALQEDIGGGDITASRTFAVGAGTGITVNANDVAIDTSVVPQLSAGNTFTVDFAKAAIKGEQLGKNKATDFLAVSFSSTDYVGHQFGVDSKEIEDTYLRLDKDLEELVKKFKR